MSFLIAFLLGFIVGLLITMVILLNRLVNQADVPNWTYKKIWKKDASVVDMVDPLDNFDIT